MSDTLEALTREVAEAREAVRDAIRRYAAATADYEVEAPQRWEEVEAALDRLCRAHEALEREMCAHSCINPSDAECIRARAPAPVPCAHHWVNAKDDVGAPADTCLDCGITRAEEG